MCSRAKTRKSPGGPTPRFVPSGFERGGHPRATLFDGNCRKKCRRTSLRPLLAPVSRFDSHGTEIAFSFPIALISEREDFFKETH